MARTEQRLRIEVLRPRAVDELGLDPDVLVAEYGPDQLVPVHAAHGAEDAASPSPGPVRPRAAGEAAAGRRAGLALLGTVNPLALEEFAALEERHQFLTEQLEDLKKSRRDLLEIVKEVDERVEQVFAEAFRDTARGVRRRVLAAVPRRGGPAHPHRPDDMLTTGLDVEARPPGKKVKRLSLLSGGERSLTAVALLVAIFKARPSPFYVMDEVEAALDDTNLGRLISSSRNCVRLSQLSWSPTRSARWSRRRAVRRDDARRRRDPVISQRLREDVAV